MTRRSVPVVRSVIIAVGGAAMVLLSAFAPASASAASVSTPSSGASLTPTASAHHEASIAKVFHVTTRYGTLTYGWRPFSGNSGTLIPRSASGCNFDVCISITGSSTYVDDWNTTAYWNGGYICTHSVWLQNGNIIRTGNGTCGGAGVFFSDWAPKKNFQNESKLCNKWEFIPGEPCEYIEI